MLMYFLIPHRCVILFFFFFFNDTATTEIYTLSLHDALPISEPPEPPDPAEPPYRNRCITSDWTPLAASRESGLRSEEHTSELQSRLHLVCRLLLEKKKKKKNEHVTDLNKERETHISSLGIDT